ncbi:hypothetical protein Agub_g9384, partial [Astrephomene gubernaculifera]
GGAIVSASLDKTLRVWHLGRCVATLTGHEGPVLSLLVLPATGEILSGSGDTTVRLWAPQQPQPPQSASETPASPFSSWRCVRTLKAHADTVRGMCLVPGLGFATASHDMGVKVWDASGGLLAELVGHTAIVYCVAAVEAPAGAGGGLLLASGSEDNSVRVWRPSGECLQVIEHPGNIWAVDFTPDGDLLTGSSDAVARLWSRRPDRTAPADVAAALTSAVEQRKAAAAAGGGGGEGGGGGNGGGGAALPPGLKVEEAFVLSQPGAKNGENKFVRDAATGDVVAYSWDGSAFQWEKLGVVVAGPQQGGGGGGGPVKKFHAGREWDYVFDVDVGEGQPPRKLALNAADNPYLVAQGFIQEHDLPPYFQEQIVQFILTNTGGGKAAAGGPEPMDITGGFCDPFTGGGGSSRPPAAPRLPAGTLPASITGGGVDPFTGGGGSSSSRSAGGLPAFIPTHVPCHTLLTFDNVPNLEALGRKIREFNSSESVPAPLRLSEQDLATGGPLDTLLQKLPKIAAAAAATAAAAAAAAPASAPLTTPADISLLRRLLSWPAACLFPALDVARLVALEGGAVGAAGAAAGGGAALLAAPEVAGDLTAAEPQAGTLAGALAAAAASPLPANHQLALRLAANAAASPPAAAVGPLRSWTLAAASPLLDRLAPLATAPTANKAVRMSAAVLYGNLAAAAALRQLPSAAAAEEVPLQLLSAALELLSQLAAATLAEADAVYRCLVAVGTLLSAGGKELCLIARDLDINERIHSVMQAARGGGATEHKLLQAGIEVTAVIARSTGVKVAEA